MKKIKKCMIAIVVFAMVIISSTSCKKKVYIDVDKILKLHISMKLEEFLEVQDM